MAIGIVLEIKKFIMMIHVSHNITITTTTINVLKYYYRCIYATEV